MRVQKYLQAVRELNRARMDKDPFPIATKFREAVASLSDHQALYLYLISSGCRLHGAGRCLAQWLVSPDPFPRAYTATAHQSYNSPLEHGSSLRDSTLYTNRRFFQHVQERVRDNPFEARLGGIPGGLSKVTAYTKLVIWRSGVILNDNIEVPFFTKNRLYKIYRYGPQCFI